MNFNQYCLEIQEVLERCALACEMEAIAENMPPLLGRDIFFTLFYSSSVTWTDEAVAQWIRGLETTYSFYNLTPELIKDLCNKCSEVMARYIPLMESVVLPN